MAFRKKRYNKRRFAKKRTMKKRGVKRPALKRMIRREIARNVENKTIQHYDYDQRLYAIGNASFNTDNVFPLGPDAVGLVVQQGVGQGQRVGNMIKTKRLVFKGSIVPLPYDSTFNTIPVPMQVKMWIFYDRTTPTVQPNVPAANDFFQNGNTTKGFQGDLTDLWSPVNTDRYRVLTTRTFKLGFADYNGTGATPSFQQFANNDFKLNANFSVDLTKYYPQIVKFNDNGTTPTTRGLWCMMTYAPATGGVLSSTQYAVGMQWMQTFVYEDA